MVCNICPRKCNIDRSVKKGFCRVSDTVKVARASLHMWEEPCISAKVGSGAVFFSGCNMRCVFCQNKEISLGSVGKEITVERLAEIFLELQGKKAANINLVTPTHYTKQITEAIDIARKNGLVLPIIYNTSSYETVENIRSLDGYIDVYLPDFKYFDDNLSVKFSQASNYHAVALRAIEEMVRQVGECRFDADGIINKGVIVRHLILPGHTQDSIKVLEELHDRFSDRIYISVMSQYTPVHNQEKYTELNRKLTKREYDKVLNKAVDIGIVNGFIQEGKTAQSSFIPQFDCSGV